MGEDHNVRFIKVILRFFLRRGSNLTLRYGNKFIISCNHLYIIEIYYF